MANVYSLLALDAIIRCCLANHGLPLKWQTFSLHKPTKPAITSFERKACGAWWVYEQRSFSEWLGLPAVLSFFMTHTDLESLNPSLFSQTRLLQYPRSKLFLHLHSIAFFSLTSLLFFKFEQLLLFTSFWSAFELPRSCLPAIFDSKFNGFQL